MTPRPMPHAHHGNPAPPPAHLGLRPLLLAFVRGVAQRLERTPRDAESPPCLDMELAIRQLRDLPPGRRGRVAATGRLSAREDLPQQDGPIRAGRRPARLPGRRRTTQALDDHGRHRIRSAVPSRQGRLHRNGATGTRRGPRDDQAAGGPGRHRPADVGTFAPCRIRAVAGRTRGVAGGAAGDRALDVARDARPLRARAGSLPRRGGPPAAPKEKQLQKTLEIGETVAIGSVNVG